MNAVGGELKGSPLHWATRLVLVELYLVYMTFYDNLKKLFLLS